jgi:intracellular sulfur oxidation DsrE/DsrF family protein
VHAAFAEPPVLGPVIEGFGPAYAVRDRDIALTEGFEYRVVFDAYRYPGGPSALNRELETVARFLNMHGLNGVSLENLNVAVVIHGEALKSLLQHDAYQSRYQADNPNLELLTALHNAGVNLYACGQSLGFRNIDNDELADPVKVVLSAMTQLATLQADGFALLP